MRRAGPRVLELPSWDRPGGRKLDAEQFTQVLRAPAFGAVRAGPPFPYLRWSGPSPAWRRPEAALPRGPPAVGARADPTSMRSPVTGCANASRSACRNWRSSPWRAGAAVLGVAGHRVADRQQVRADLVRAPGLEPHPQQRVAGQRALGLEVGDRARGLVGVGRDPRAHAAVAAERRVDRPARAPAGGPRRARGTRARSRARAARACSAAWASSARATTQQPGRVAVEPVHDARRARGPPAAPTRPASACASVPGCVAARRVHDDARRLVDHEQVLVLVGDRERRVGHVGARRPRRRRSTSIVSPPRSTWRLGRGAPSTRTAPASISRCAAAREPAARRGRRRAARPPRRRGTCSSRHWRGGPSST